MTEQIYTEPLVSLHSDLAPSPVTSIPVMQNGRAALEAINDV